MKRVALRGENGEILELYDPFTHAPGVEPQQIEFDADALVLRSYNFTFDEHEFEEKFNTPDTPGNELLDDVLNHVWHHIPGVDSGKPLEERTNRVYSATIEECCDNCGLLSCVCKYKFSENQNET